MAYTLGALVPLTQIVRSGIPTPYTLLSIIPQVLRPQITVMPQPTAVPVVAGTPAKVATAPLPVPSVTTSTASPAPQSNVLQPAPTPEPATTPNQGGAPTVPGSPTLSTPLLVGLAALLAVAVVSGSHRGRRR